MPALGFGTITASSWRCSGLLPGVSPVFDRTETILGEIFSPLARLPELSLGALPPREHALGFGTITASFWRCSGLIPGSPQYSIVQKTILGGIFSPLARLPELSLGALPPRKHALGFGTITASSWRCSGLIPGVSPVFDRTENYSGGNLFPTRQAPQAVSGSREHALGFGTITASSWRCNGLLPGVSPVFDRTGNYSGGNLFPTRQAPRAVSGSASPLRARSRVWYHHGIFLAL